MAVTLTASPSVLDFSMMQLGTGQALSTKISWDTGANAIRGRLHVSIDGGADQLLPDNPAGGARAGSLVYSQIRFGHLYNFLLRRADDQSELARLQVRTTHHLAPPPDGYLNEMQLIAGLTIVPRVDRIDFAFRTRLPAAPWVQVTDAGTGAIMALRSRPEMRTTHRFTLEAWGQPLRQDTEYRYRIITAPHLPVSALGNAEDYGTLRMGSRTTRLHFDVVHVRNAGDPGNTGDFTFYFAGGDVDTEERIGAVERWGEGQIGEGQNRAVHRVVTIPHAPPRIWAKAAAYERDTCWWNCGLPSSSWIWMTYTKPGSGGFEDEWGANAYVTQHFDTDAIAFDQPFILKTLDLGIAFDVHGHIEVERVDGWAHSDKPLALGRPKRYRGHKEIGHGLRRGSSVTFPKGGGFTGLAFGPDAVVQLAGPGARGPAAVEPMRLGGPLTVLVTDDAIDLFGVTPEGAVACRRLRERDGGLRRLDGAFTGEVIAVAGRDGSTELIARDGDGQAYHRTLISGDRPTGPWERLGRVADPVVLAAEETGVALFAFDDQGQVVHKRLAPDGRWQPPNEWERLGAPSGRGLVAEWADAEGVVLTLWSDDGSAQVLLWPGYPDPARRGDWFPAYPELIVEPQEARAEETGTDETGTVLTT